MGVHLRISVVQWMEISDPLDLCYLLIQTHLLCVDSKTPHVVT